MAISFTKYVNIISGVGGGNNVAQRQLILRVFTNNPLLPTGTNIEFLNSNDVGTYFGFSSEEYKRAAFYFAWVSKNIAQCPKISYSRWADTATAPLIYGAVSNNVIGNFTSIVDGSFGLTLGGQYFNIGPINFSGASSLSAVAALIQTAIQAKTGGGALFTAATVSYDPVRKSFQLVSGQTGNNTIATSAGTTGTDISSLLGWLAGNGAILSNGSLVQTLTQMLVGSSGGSDNFGTFVFVQTLTQAQIIEVATWNATQNNKYQYHVQVSTANAANYASLLAQYPGVGLTVQSPAGTPVTEYPELAPCMIIAATDYTKRNSVQNMMFQQFNLTPSVSDDLTSSTYDTLGINYYGQSQTAGQLINFYQRGVLQGPASSPTDMNVYANEQWLKSACGSQIMTLLLNLSRVSANAKGRSQVLAILQPIIVQAQTNGTISQGATLTPTQQAYITDQTGDDKAWYQVASSGFWVDCTISSSVNTAGKTSYQANYSLIYKKDDVIRSVQGTHTLI